MADETTPKRWQRIRITHPSAVGRLAWVCFQTNVTRDRADIGLTIRRDQFEFLEEFAEDVKLVDEASFYKEEEI